MSGEIPRVARMRPSRRPGMTHSIFPSNGIMRYRNMRKTSKKYKKQPKSPLGPGGISKKGQQKLNSSKTNIGENSPRCTDASVSSSGYDTFNFPVQLNYEMSKYAKNV